MKPNIFVTLFNAKAKHSPQTSNELIDIAKGILKPKPYLSYDTKLELVDITLQQTQNSPHVTADRYRQFVVNLISAYTEIDMDKDGFDLFSETGLLDVILSTFENEYETCTTVMNMCLRDLEGR